MAHFLQGQVLRSQVPQRGIGLYGFCWTPTVKASVFAEWVQALESAACPLTRHIANIPCKLSRNNAFFHTRVCTFQTKELELELAALV